MDPYIILTKTEQGVWIETKEIGIRQWSLQQSSKSIKNSWSLYKERILRRGYWSILHDQISIRETKETHETGQISILNWNLQPIGLSYEL